MKKIPLTAVILVLALGAAAAAEVQAASKRLKKGQRLLRLQQYDRAIRQFEEANQEAGGESAGALLGLAQSRLALGQYREAEAAVRALLAVSEDPGDQGEAYSLLGVALYQQSLGSGLGSLLESERAPSGGKLPEAARVLQRVIDIRGEAATVDRYNLAEVLVQLGRHEQAAVLLDQYFELAGDNDKLLGPRELRCWLEATRGEPVTSKVPDTTPPRRVYAAVPKSTPLARRYRLEGSVLVHAVIDEAGKVQCARPLRGLPMGLTESAVRAAKASKFEPAVRDGKPVRAFYVMTIGFSYRTVR